MNYFERGRNMNAYDEYMKGIVKPMREELVQNGFTELTTAEEVEGTMEKLRGRHLSSLTRFVDVRQVLRARQ